MSVSSGFGRTILAIYGVISAIFTILVIIVAVMVFTDTSPDITNTLYESAGIEHTNENQIILGITTSVVAIVYLLETWLLFRASHRPKKSTLLLILSLLSLVLSIISLFQGHTSTSNIISLVWAIVLVVGVLLARSR